MNTARIKAAAADMPERARLRIGFVALSDAAPLVAAQRLELGALYPNTARLLVRTLLDACEWLDDADHRMKAAAWLAEPDAIGVPIGQIAPRLLGDYGAGPFAQPPAPIKFYEHGTVNRPAASDGMWFLSQYRRWGMLSGDVDDAAIANGVAHTALYDEAVALGGARRGE